jgi:hypothetical protein
MNRRCIGIAGLLFILLGQRAAARGNPEGWVELFNGRDLQGWHWKDPHGPKGWIVQDGVYVNHPPSTDIQTDQDYYNFQLHIEFNIAPGSNSGVYLRDKYEVQILDSYRKPASVESCGALFGRIAPATDAARQPGTWQTFDITFVGRRLTVLQNGTRVLHNVDVGPKGTGRASDCPDGPGPLRLQGDHGMVMFRNVRLRPLSATEAARMQQEMEKER